MRIVIKGYLLRIVDFLAFLLPGARSSPQLQENRALVIDAELAGLAGFPKHVNGH
jgi:hypothetical protein